MATLTENVARVTSALVDIKNAIIDRGVTPTGKCETFASAIASIPSGGTDVSDTTAVASDVVSGKIFHTADGASTTGTLTVPNVATGTFSASTSGLVTITCGFKPKYLTISSSTEYGNVAATETFVYFSTASSIQRLRWFRNTSNQLQQDTTTYTDGCLSLTTTGFKYMSRVGAGKTMRYTAIG